MKTLNLVTVFCLCVMLQCINAHAINDSHNLIDTLFQNYQERFRPVYNQSQAVKVDVTLSMLSIHSFDAVSGVLTFTCGIYVTWHDYRLQWNPPDYGGVFSANVFQSEIWHPKMYLLSTAEDFKSIGRYDFPNRLLFNGTVIMSIGHQMKSTCTSDIRKFPKDVHICDILFAPSDLASEVVLSTSTSSFLFHNFTQNGEWGILNRSAKSYIGHAGLFSVASFVIVLERKPTYFMIIMIIPMLMLGMMAPMVFLLPVQSGERVSYTITTFLSFAIYMSLIGDNLPNNTEPMPYLSFMLMALLSGSALITMATIFTIRIHHQKDFNGKRFFTSSVCSISKLKCRTKSVRPEKVKSFESNEECINEFKQESEHNTNAGKGSHTSTKEMLQTSFDRFDGILFRFFTVYMTLSTALYLGSIYV